MCILDQLSKAGSNCRSRIVPWFYFVGDFQSRPSQRDVHGWEEIWAGSGKLVREFPELHSIDLSGRGDPIHHPDLQSIISLASEQTFTTVVTRLSCAKPKIDKLLQSDVDQIVVDFSDILSEDAAQMLLGNLAYLETWFGKKILKLNFDVDFKNGKATLNFCHKLKITARRTALG